MRTLRFILALNLLLLTGGAVTFSAETPSGPTSDEMVMASRIEQLVHEIGGVSKAWVWVKIETDWDRYEKFIKALSAAQKAANKRKPRPAKPATPQSMDVLPGVTTDEFASIFKDNPTRKTIAEKTKLTDPDATMKMVSWFRKISVSIAVPSNILPERLADLKKKIPLLVGLKASDGDTLVIDTFPAEAPPAPPPPKPPPPTTMERIMEWLGHITPWMAAGWLCLLTTILFLFGPVTSFLREFASALQTIRVHSQSTSSIKNQSEMKNKTEELEEQSEISGKLSAEANGNGSPSQDLFAFMTEEKMPNLIQIAHGETPEHVAMLVSYLKPDWASRIISDLPDEKRQTVLAHFTSETSFEPEAVTAFAERLKETIDFVAGPERLLHLLEDAPAEIRDAMLWQLEKSSPETAQYVRSKLITTLDLFEQDPKVLKKVLWEAHRQKVSLAGLIKSTPQEIREKLMKQLPEAISDVVRKEIASIGELTPERVEAEGHKLLQVARRMEKSGEIPPLQHKD